jgi:hypothetical protein
MGGGIEMVSQSHLPEQKDASTTFEICAWVNGDV